MAEEQRLRDGGEKRLMDEIEYWAKELVRRVGCDCSFTIPSGTTSMEDVANVSVDMEEGNQILIGKETVLSGRNTISIRGKRNVLIISDAARIADASITVRSNGNVIILGDRILLRKVILKATGGNSAVIIGSGATWVGGSALNESRDCHIVIGNDCMFARDVVLRTDDGHGIFSRETQEQINIPSSVSVHEHVWLGSSARVNKGSVVHRGSVIGAGSVVSGAVEAHCVYAGVPARKIRDGIVWSRTNAYADIPESFR
jgi:acetyltransferase-like isoleucine patch superfamily enzyme